MMIKVAVNGALGRMGREVIRALRERTEFSPVGGIDRISGEVEGGIPVHTEADEIVSRADVVIDFSLPAGTAQIVKVCSRLKTPLISGTTGLSADQMNLLHESGSEIAVVYAANFSIGINLLLRLVEITAGVLKEKADVEIVETHHRMKKDAPSGTALLLAQRITETLGKSADSALQFGRHGKELSRGKEIGIHSLRGGSVIGEHQVYFFAENENLVLSHQALNRKIFVDGALLAAEWILNQPAGFYSMQDVLGF